MDGTFDDFGPLFARWLAPYLREEFAREQGGDSQAHQPAGDFDDEACREFVKGLKTPVLTKAAPFFTHLARNGEVDSVRLAQDLSLASPRELPGPLTTPLKRRAKELNLGLPWTPDATHEDRTVWRDRDGIGARMLDAIREEQHRRGS